MGLLSAFLPMFYHVYEVGEIPSTLVMETSSNANGWGVRSSTASSVYGKVAYCRRTRGDNATPAMIFFDIPVFFENHGGAEAHTHTHEKNGGFLVGRFRHLVEINPFHASQAWRLNLRSLPFPSFFFFFFTFMQGDMWCDVLPVSLHR